MKHQIIVLIIVLNLTFAATAYAQLQIESTVDVNPCVTNCLILEIPDPIDIKSVKFVKPEDTLSQVFNYDLGQKISITDIRTPTTEWTIVAQIGNFVDTQSPTQDIILDYKQIGILTFANSETLSTDSYFEEPGITAPLDSAYDVESFQQGRITPSDFQYGQDSSPINPDYSEEIPILTSYPSPQTNQHSIGIGANIIIPDAPNFTIIDSDYTFDILFTLSY